jgi:hypothetical protein
VAKFKYLGTILTNRNDIHDEIKGRLNSGMLAIIQSKIFCLPISNTKLKIKIDKTVILPVVLYRCETCSLTLRQEQRFENRGYLELIGRKTDRGENCIIMNFIACILHLVFIG